MNYIEWHQWFVDLEPIFVFCFRARILFLNVKDTFDIQIQRPINTIVCNLGIHKFKTNNGIKRIIHIIQVIHANRNGKRWTFLTLLKYVGNTNIRFLRFVEVSQTITVPWCASYHDIRIVICIYQYVLHLDFDEVFHSYFLLVCITSKQQAQMSNTRTPTQGFTLLPLSRDLDHSWPIL